MEVNGKKVDIRFFEDPEITKQAEEFLDSTPICKCCKLDDICEKLKDPYHPSDNYSSFANFCNVAGIGLDSRDFDVKKRLTLKELKDKINNNPELYKVLLKSGKESFNLTDIILEFDETTIPCYEDVEPILEDLKKSNKKDQIPIVSVGKDITQEEFSQQYYQPGKVYKINNGLLHKCTGYTSGGRPIIDTICFILQPDSHSGYQIIKNINAEGDVIPGLDFVNKRMSGDIQEIDSIVWDSIDELCCSLCKNLQEIIREKSESIVNT